MSALAAVKKRLGQLKADIDEAEDREAKAKNNLVEVEARGLNAEGERTSLENRKNQLEADLERVTRKLEEQQAKLEAAEARTIENDKVRKELEGVETDNDQDLIMLEQNAKDTKLLVSENQLKFDDALNKFKVLESELERVYDRHTSSHSKVEQLEGEAQQVNTDLKDLETKDEEISKREMSLEDQVRYLDSQCKETDHRADEGERRVAQLEMLRDSLNGGIELEKMKKQNILDEMERTMQEALDAVGDPDDLPPPPVSEDD